MNHIRYYEVRSEARSDVALGYVYEKSCTSEKQIGWRPQREVNSAPAFSLSR